jgi:hypothetical protein
MGQGLKWRMRSHREMMELQSFIAEHATDTEMPQRETEREIYF